MGDVKRPHRCLRVRGNGMARSPPGYRCRDGREAGAGQTRARPIASPRDRWTNRRLRTLPPGSSRPTETRGTIPRRTRTQGSPSTGSTPSSKTKPHAQVKVTLKEVDGKHAATKVEATTKKEK